MQAYLDSYVTSKVRKLRCRERSRHERTSGTLPTEEPDVQIILICTPADRRCNAAGPAPDQADTCALAVTRSMT
jgi:hypothetical protein